MSGSDDELIRKACAGDEPAHAELLERVAIKLEKELAPLDRQTQLGIGRTDQLQDTLIEVNSQLEKGQFRGHTFAEFWCMCQKIYWSKSTTLRKFLHRKKRDIRRNQRHVGIPTSSDASAFEPVSTTAGPVQEVISRELMQIWLQSKSQLPEDEAAIFQAYLDNTPIAEIARQRSISRERVEQIRTNTITWLLRILRKKAGET